MTIRLGANPIGWSNDDLKEIGGDIPLETCLAEAREAGFVDVRPVVEIRGLCGVCGAPD